MASLVGGRLPVERAGATERLGGRRQNDGRVVSGRAIGGFDVAFHSGGCALQYDLGLRTFDHKQQMRIKVFYGTSLNAVSTQIWIAITIYLLIAIIKKEMILKPNLSQVLQIASVSILDRTPISQAFQPQDNENAEVLPRFPTNNTLQLARSFNSAGPVLSWYYCVGNPSLAVGAL